MKTSSVSISNRIVIFDETRGFSRFIKLAFPNLSNLERYCRLKDIESIDLKEEDILFLVVTNPSDFNFYSNYFNKVKYIFIYIPAKYLVIDSCEQSNVFIIDKYWVRRDVINYISKVLLQNKPCFTG